MVLDPVGVENPAPDVLVPAKNEVGVPPPPPAAAPTDAVPKAVLKGENVPSNPPPAPPLPAVGV